MLATIRKFGVCAVLSISCLTNNTPPDVQQHQQAQWAQPPNVLLWVFDDFGITSTSAFGGSYLTPNLEALANSGVKCLQGFSQPICGVSRAELLSGLYPERTRVIDHAHLNKYTTTMFTLPKAFQSIGYTTILAGKWQLGPTPLDTVQEGVGFGWNTWLAWNTGGVRYYGATHNRDGIDETYSASVFGPDKLQEFAIDAIDQAEATSTPWFLYYSTTLVHDQGSPAFVAPPGSAALTQAEKYAAMVSYMDAQVGEMVAHLEMLGIEDETLIIAVGDNGSSSNSNVVRTINGDIIDGWKSTLLEGGVRVPWIVSWSGTLPPAISERLMDLTDVWPTLSEITGIPLASIYDGQSFARELAGVYTSPRSWTYVQLGEHPSCYLRGRTHKVYCNGTCASMADAPFYETSSTDGVCAGLEGDLTQLFDNMTP